MMPQSGKSVVVDSILDLQKVRKPKHVPKHKGVKTSNKFSALAEEESEELVLEDGVVVRVLEPKTPTQPTGFTGSPPLTTSSTTHASPKISSRFCRKQRGSANESCCTSIRGEVTHHGNRGGSSAAGDRSVLSRPDPDTHPSDPGGHECGLVSGLFELGDELHHVNTPEWVQIDVVMDSGAAESVAPSSIAPWLDIKESEGSKFGRKYLSASGEVLPNLGEKNLDVVTEEGMAAKTTFQIADVTRPLCSIARVCDKGNQVVFHAEGGYVEDRHGNRSHFERKNNIYMMTFHALDPGSKPSDAGFARQS